MFSYSRYPPPLPPLPLPLLPSPALALEIRPKCLAEQKESTCRFSHVCSRCASECDSDAESGAIIADPGHIPFCENCPEGAASTTRGATIETLELLPGFYRSTLTSSDIRECLYEAACHGGRILGEYCAPGYSGPCEKRFVHVSMIVCLLYFVFLFWRFLFVDFRETPFFFPL